MIDFWKLAQQRAAELYDALPDEEKEKYKVLKPDESEDLHSLIRGAIARGYCHKKNENKVLDPDLIEAMTEEISSMLSGDK